MDGQRQRSGNGRKRRRRSRGEARTQAEPVLIAARRPNSPIISKGNGQVKLVAASASPAQAETRAGNGAERPQALRPAAPAPKRSARIVQLTSNVGDEREKQRQRLLERLMCSEGRGAISRAATDYQQAGFEFPEEQEVQLQLLEHFDEGRAHEAVLTLERLLSAEAPIKKPVLEQRLRRLEEYADEPATREAAAQLRKNLRS